MELLVQATGVSQDFFVCGLLLVILLMIGGRVF
jgi:hypothetical protein